MLEQGEANRFILQTVEPTPVDGAAWPAVGSFRSLLETGRTEGTARSIGCSYESKQKIVLRSIMKIIMDERLNRMIDDRNNLLLVGAALPIVEVIIDCELRASR